MVYKKYIKRGSKLFGPYYYKSIKKDGKVITQYVKTPDDFPKKTFPVSKKIRKNLLIFPILFLILIASFFILKHVLTGKVILSVDNSYVSGEALFVELTLNLEPKEFIPADTKLIINEKEFILKNLIQENPKQGEFYISGTDISGFGDGYGNKEEDLDVPFVLDILSEKKQDKEISKEDENTETEINEVQINETDEEIQINETDEEIQINETETEIPVAEETQIENLEPTEPPAEDIETPAETITEPENSAESEITGSIIKKIFSKFYLAITGKTSLENINEIQGKVSKDKPFVYILEQDQTAEIKNSYPEEWHKDKKINLEIINNTATITTDYSGEKTEYLINLSELNITVSQKDLEIKLVYNETEFYSINKNLNIEMETNQTIQDINLSADESLVQYGAVLGEPVKWKKKITTNESKIVVELPKEAENISIYKIESANVILSGPIAENTSLLTTGNIILEYK